MEDYEAISVGLDRSPEQCMIKMREILMTGSTSAASWCKAEDELLVSAVKDGMSWKKVSEYINNVIHSEINVRNLKHCKERWNNHLNPEICKGQWTPQEDLELLMVYQEKKNKWSAISKRIGKRNENTVKNRINSLVNKERQLSGDCCKEEAVERIISRLSSS